jgi:Fe-S cluster assembly ATP-binding protein
MAEPLFSIQDLHVKVEDTEILKGLNLEISKGEVHALMGRNGSGKTTLSNTLMGHPSYTITKGKILLRGEDITELSPDERAKKRMFLAFQYPVEVPGVTVGSFLRTSIRHVRGDEVPLKEVRKLIRKEMAELDIPEEFMKRSLNEGFSGGEKKRLETLQMRCLEPHFAILDETDSGLDIDALKKVASNVDALRSPDRSILLITHYQRMLDYVKPDRVHVLMDGKIVKSGDYKLALKLEEEGYEWLQTSKNTRAALGEGA